MVCGSPRVEVMGALCVGNDLKATNTLVVEKFNVFNACAQIFIYSTREQ